MPAGLALGKEFKKKYLPSACRVGTRQSDRQRARRRDGHFSLPSAPVALGKAFAECPIKDTRQRGLCRLIFSMCSLPSAALGKGFAECRTRQRLCRVQFGLCRVPQALDKEPESSSEYKSLNALRLLTIFWFRAPQCAIYWFRRSPYEEQSSKLESVCRHEGDSWDPLDLGTKTHSLSLSLELIRAEVWTMPRGY